MKKGFTLIEIIVTIGLIALIGTVIVSNLSATYTKQREEQYQNFKRVLENAACVYIDLDVASSIRSTCRSNGSCTISVSTILQEGLIEDDDLINPKTEEAIPGTTNISVTYTNGVKTCSYPE